jgi:hypothetical protein
LYLGLALRGPFLPIGDPGRFQAACAIAASKAWKIANLRSGSQPAPGHSLSSLDLDELDKPSGAYMAPLSGGRRSANKRFLCSALCPATGINRRKWSPANASGS